MKKICTRILHSLFFPIWLLFLSAWVYAQDAQWDVEFLNCPIIGFSVLGQEEVKSNQLYEYTLTAEDYSEYASWLNVNHTIWNGPDQLAAFDEESFSYEFSEPGWFLLKTDITLENWCEYILERPITSYDKIIVYLGKWSDVLELSKSQSGTGNIQQLFKKIEIDDTNSSEKVFDNLSSYVSYFRYADDLIVDTSSQWLIFESLWKLFSVNEIDTGSLNTYVIADTAQSYFRRLLARYITSSGLEKVYVTQEQYFGSLFTSLLLNDDPLQYDFIKSYSVSLEDSNKRTFLSYITDYILINWFPLGILTLVLLLPFVWLLISVARQVVWLSVFGVFTPLLFAISMYVIGIAPSFFLLLSAAIAVIITHLISKKIYLLYSPKISLMMILYCIVSLIIRWAHESLALELVNYSAYANSFAIFPFVVILLVAKGVFSDNFLQFRKWRWTDLLEFFGISLWVLYILNSPYLQNIFLGNPELILVVLLLNILVGRFTWLQITEYFRFFPLIKNYFEEE